MTAAKKVIERFYEVEQGMNEYGDGPYVNFSITVSARIGLCIKLYLSALG